MSASMTTGSARAIHRRITTISALSSLNLRAFSLLNKNDLPNNIGSIGRENNNVSQLHHRPSSGLQSHHDRFAISSLPFSTSTASIVTSDDDSSDDKNSTKDSKNYNSEKALLTKVDSIVSQPLGSTHPTDLRFKYLQLLKDCCRLHTLGGIHSAEELLRKMLQEIHFINEKGGDTKEGQLYIGDRAFHAVMFGWARLCSHGKDNGRGADKIEELIQLMEKEYKHEVNTRKKFARKKLFKTIGMDEIKGDDGEYDEGDLNADYEGIMREKETEGEKNRRERLSCKPSIRTYNILLYALAETAQHIASSHSGLQRRDRRKRGKYSSSSPSPLSALQVAKRAESTLETIATTLNNNDNTARIKPNTRSYTLVLSAYANAQDFSSGDNAKRILNMMKRIHEMERNEYENMHGVPYNDSDPKENKYQIVTPDVVSYSAVIKAYANSNARGSAEKAEGILLDLIRSAGISAEEKGGNRLGPDAIAFESTIRAWAEAASQMKSPRARYEAAERAEAILELMNEAADAAEADAKQAALEKSKKENSLGADMNDGGDGWGLETKGGTLQDILQEKVDEDDEAMIMTRMNSYLRPSLSTYNAVLHAWARSDTRESAPRAEALLRRMINPNASLSESDSTSLSSIAGPIVRPDSMSFHIVMNAWARFGRYDPNSAQRAEELLDLMYDMYESGDYGEKIKPNAYSYTTVINAWARSEESVNGGTSKGDESQSVDDTSSEGNNTGEISKNSNDIGPKVDKVAHARRLLDVLISKYEGGEKDMKPNVVPYTSVLNAAAHYSQDLSSDGTIVGSEGAVENPYDIAFHTYNELIRDSTGLGLNPDHLAFAAMLKVVGKHTQPISEKRRLDIERVFDDACDAGHVSALVVRELQAACPTVDLLQRLLGSEQLAREGMRSVDELPSKWTRNVRGDPRLRRLDNRVSNKNRRKAGRQSNERNKKAGDQKR